MTTTTNQTDLHIDALALRLTELCARQAARPRIREATAIATSVAHDYLSALAPSGLWGWLVRAQVGESPRQYARRAVRHLVARAANAGVRCALTHDGAATIGAFGAGPAEVSLVERASARSLGSV